MSDKAKIVEVGPRDGLQNEKTILDTDTKFEYIKKLVDTGLKNIEVTSFVKPPAIPQMHDSSELYHMVNKEFGDRTELNFPCLVPNRHGLDSAFKVGVKEISLFTATSDSFTGKNINCTVDESFERMKRIKDRALETTELKDFKIRGYISTAFGCPYEGEQKVEKLISVIQKFIEFGVYEISIGDTIGVATPKQVKAYLQEVLKEVSSDKIAMHMHDTRGMALSNVLVSLEKGIRTFDSSSGGLGGCPYALGATGNLATEDLLYLLNSEGIKTGVDMDKLARASRYILTEIGKVSPSKYFQAVYKK